MFHWQEQRRADSDTSDVCLSSTRGRHFKSQLSCSSLGLIYGPGAAHKSASAQTINLICSAENIPQRSVHFQQSTNTLTYAKAKCKEQQQHRYHLAQFANIFILSYRHHRLCLLLGSEAYGLV